MEDTKKKGFLSKVTDGLDKKLEDKSNEESCCCCSTKDKGQKKSCCE